MIEVGEYIRIKGFIGIIENINDFREPSMKYALDIPQAGDLVFVGEDKIVKHSKNIIDLIELGDIIECFVEEDVDGEDTIKYEVAAVEVEDIKGNKLNELGICGENGIELMPFENVITILTKEQYEQNCYRLEKIC